MGRPGSAHLKGVGIAVAGTLIITPDSLLVRLIQADPWTLVFWRGLLLGATITTFLLIRYGRALPMVVGAASRPTLLAGVLAGTTTTLFVLALTHTTVANTLIIVGASPLIAAALGRIFLDEPVPARTWLAIALTMAGIGLTVSGGVGGAPASGDLFALAAAFGGAGTLVTYRAAGAADMTPSVALGGGVAAAIATPLASPLMVGAADAVCLAILGILVLPLSFGLLALAPRYLPAHEVGLLLRMEMVLGPYWVWLVLGEAPGMRAMAGGAVVMATVVAHSLVGLRQERVSGWARAQSRQPVCPADPPRR